VLLDHYHVWGGVPDTTKKSSNASISSSWKGPKNLKYASRPRRKSKNWGHNHCQYGAESENTTLPMKVRSKDETLGRLNIFPQYLETVRHRHPHPNPLEPKAAAIRKGQGTCCGGGSATYGGGSLVPTNDFPVKGRAGSQ